jgi:hypothetical protein
VNNESHDCHLIDAPTIARFSDDWQFGAQYLKKPGDFVWLSNRAGEITDLLMLIPGNEGGSIAPIPVVRGPQQGNPERWGWDGNETAPTLIPSIWRMKGSKDGRNEWHGNLTAGRLVSA